MSTSTNPFGRFRSAIVRMWRTQNELHERQSIALRPWTHDTLHWSGRDEEDGRLHGETAPHRPSDVPVTRQGWCPCPPGTHDDPDTSGELISPAGDPEH